MALLIALAALAAALCPLAALVFAWGLLWRRYDVLAISGVLAVVVGLLAWVSSPLWLVVLDLPGGLGVPGGLLVALTLVAVTLVVAMRIAVLPQFDAVALRIPLPWRKER